MRRIALFSLIFAVVAGLVTAESWQRKSEDNLRDALEGRKIVYENGAWQVFNPSGRTLYHAGRDSWGYWQIRDDEYCSSWPPSDLWTCYTVEVAGQKVRFIGPSDDVTQGRYDN